MSEVTRPASELRDELMAEAQQQQEQARDIWQDGFESGEAHGNLRYRYPPMVIAWLMSDTYHNLEIENTETQEALRVRWREQNYGERESTVVRWSDLLTPDTPNEDA